MPGVVCKRRARLWAHSVASTATTSTASASVYNASGVSATAACRPLYRRPYVYGHVRLELRKLAQLPMLRVR